MTRRRRPLRELTVQQLAMIRAQRAAQDALGEPCELISWIPVMQTYRGKRSRRVVHVWTYASEYQVELPAVPGELVPPNA